jgi:aminoglycoside phosphotransferase (APT) family kinase protein
MITPEQLAPLAVRLLPGATIVGIERLTGGVSADVHAIDLQADDGQRTRVVLRSHGRQDWKPGGGSVAASEHALLGALHRAGVLVPEPLLLDATGELTGAPSLVMRYVEGSTSVADADLDAALETMAAVLAALHDLTIEDLPELPERLDPLPELFDWLPGHPHAELLARRLAGWDESAYTGPPRLLHGDFWPGNLLWRGRELVAILDWEDAAVGDPLCDLAGCRLELLWKYGAPASERFTRAYREHRPVDALRTDLWGVYVATAGCHYMSQWGLDPAAESEMRRRANGFIETAATRLLQVI